MFRRGRAVLVALLLVAGCSARESPPRSAEPGPLPRMSHSRAPAPGDRDEQAVLSALRRLDPCALIDADVPGVSADLTPAATGPHGCELNRAHGDDAVRVILGAPFGAEQRFGAEVLTLGGAKAYLNAHKESCDVHLPVSFRLAIRFWAIRGSRVSQHEDMCRPAREFAAYAASRLAEPDRIPTRLPLSDWDACQVLAAALGANPDGYRLAIDEPRYGVDSCAADPARPRRQYPDVSARLKYEPDPAYEYRRVRTIGDRAVRVYAGTPCVVAWSNGKLPAQSKGNTDQVVELTAPDCAKGEAMVLAALARLAEPAPPAPVPQHPLTFRPDEPDIGVPGACADYTHYDDPNVCQPHVDVPIPASGGEIVRAAADPNVSCAFSRAAVARHLGDRLRPVTSGTACVFVEPTRAIQVQIRVQPSGRPATNGRAVQVSGRTGYASERSSAPGAHHYRIEVVPTQAPDPGLLSVELAIGRPRGAAPDAPVDTSTSNRLQPIVADILATYFAG